MCFLNVRRSSRDDAEHREDVRAENGAENVSESNECFLCRVLMEYIGRFRHKEREGRERIRRNVARGGVTDEVGAKREYIYMYNELVYGARARACVRV